MNKYHESIRTYLAKKDDKLKCSEFVNMVTIQHGDGSHFTLTSAIVEQKKFNDFEVLLVWTEHCGFFYFFVEDLEHWGVYKRV